MPAGAPRPPCAILPLRVRAVGCGPDAPGSGEPAPSLRPIEQRVYAVLTQERRNAKPIANLAKRSLSYGRAALRSLRDKGLVDYRAPLGWKRIEEQSAWPGGQLGPGGLSHLCAQLASLTAEPLHICIRSSRLHVTLDVRAAIPGELKPGLTPIEQRVYGALTEEFQSAKTIARLAEQAHGYVRAALGSLCGKELAEYRARQGYRLPGGQPS